MQNEDIKTITTVKEYLDCLKKISDRYTILLAVCDTPGDKMPEYVLVALHGMGFKSLTKELWRMYIGVVRFGKPFIDCLASKVIEPVTCRKKINTVTVEMESKSWMKGNKSVIEINGVECSINKRGINIVIYDELENKVIDSIRYDSLGYERLIEHNMDLQSINNKLYFLRNDEEFDILAQRIINKCKLKKNNRVGLVRFGNNIGDSYYLVASITYAKKKTNKQYVLISDEKNPVHTFVKWHNSNGADIDAFFLSEEDKQIFFRASKFVKAKYAGILDDFSLDYDDYIMLNLSMKHEDVHHNLTRPKFPEFNKEKYIKELGVVPGKTVFVIPDSVWHGTLPLYFWTMAIGFFQMMGYKVIVNAPSNSKKYGDVTCFFPSLDEIVCFCDLCGILFTVRSGLSELLCTETKAKCYIFTMEGLWSIFEAYPFIDNSDKHITEIILPKDDKEDFFWIKNATDTLRQTRKFMRDNILLSNVKSAMPEMKKYANMLSFLYNPAKVPFVDVPYYRCESFCEVSYLFFESNGVLVLSLDVSPQMEYVVHVALKKANTRGYVTKCEYYNLLNAKFDIDKDGDYIACVHIVHPQSKANSIFETERVHVSLSSGKKIIKCWDYLRYISLLKEYKKDLVILIVSRDAHTDPGETRKLELDEFAFKTDLQHTYRHSWLAVIDGGEVVQEMSSPNEEVRAVYSWNGNSAELTSAGFNVNGNDTTSVHIKINGKERAVNRRGLNIVVWDKSKNSILDSVCFDTFWNMKGYRNSSLE